MLRWLPLFLLLCVPVYARAEFNLSSAIVEFTADGSVQQDVELVSRGKDSDYIVTDVFEVQKPGQPDETRRRMDDPALSRLLVTPDKTVLAAGGRRVLRFVLLQPLDAGEHIYRVTVKPVIRGVANDAKVGLKVLVGYEVLAILRPAAPQPVWQAVRQGHALQVANRGNTNVLFQHGQQCIAPDKCTTLPTVRIYAGSQESIALPGAGLARYSVWDGAANRDASYP